LKKAKNDYDFHDIDFICADGMNLPFRDNVFMLIICNHVYEHLPDSGKLFEEIYRILMPRGACYCAAGNALAIMEPHYNLPFLSCIPKKFAHYYLKQMNRGTYYYENLLTWWSFKKLF
jgi:Methylase involved in ubiquinone/menaquinone biosynthesis